MYVTYVPCFSICYELLHNRDKGTLMPFHFAISFNFKLNFEKKEKFEEPHVVHSELNLPVCHARGANEDEVFILRPQCWRRIAAGGGRQTRTDEELQQQYARGDRQSRAGGSEDWASPPRGASLRSQGRARGVPPVARLIVLTVCGQWLKVTGSAAAFPQGGAVPGRKARVRLTRSDAREAEPACQWGSRPGGE